MTFQLNNGAKLSRGHNIYEKEGTEVTASLLFLYIHAWACNLSCWQSAYDWNETTFELFPLGPQISQISYCIIKKPVICTNLITCSAKLSLRAAEHGQ